MSRTRRIGLLFGGAFILLVALSVGMGVWEHRRLAPPKGVKTLREFSKRMPIPLFLDVIQTSSKEFLLWSGPLSSGLYLPSGPPAYVFDESGQLLDWTPDSGDDSRFQSTWGGGERVRIKLEDALQKFKSR